MALRLIFMGTPDFAVPTLERLVADGHAIAAVYTRAPKAAGRGMVLTPSPVERAARAGGLVIETPKTLKSAEAQQRFASFNADAAVVVAYGLLLPKAVLEAPRLGAFNLHGSLLPRWRGAAPINRAVMAGDAQSGVMVMKMDEGLDTGAVAMEARMAITPSMTAGDLHDALAPIGADLMSEAMRALEAGRLTVTPQPAAGVTYAAKIDKAETRIDWSRPASDVHNHIRGLSPFPGAWFALGTEGKEARIKVLRTERAEGSGFPGTLLDDALTIACGTGAVRLVEVQRAGKGAMSATEFLRGARLSPGMRFP